MAVCNARSLDVQASQVLESVHAARWFCSFGPTALAAPSFLYPAPIALLVDVHLSSEPRRSYHRKHISLGTSVAKETRLAILPRFPQFLLLIEPNLLQQNPLKVSFLVPPPSLTAFPILELLIHRLELLREPRCLCIGVERLRFEDESSAGEEGLEAAREESEQTFVAAVQMNPFRDGEPAKS
mgnify:CR=1 FL=1